MPYGRPQVVRLHGLAVTVCLRLHEHKPPVHLIHLFHIPENQVQRFATITHRFGLARGVRNDPLEEVVQLEEGCDKKSIECFKFIAKDNRCDYFGGQKYRSNSRRRSYDG